jgi:anhydro-N-acetylmuramic acid kinase
MTGTSIDGLDAALVRIEGVGLSMRATLVRMESSPFPTDLARGLRAAADQQPMSAGAFARLAADFADHHVSAIRTLMERHSATAEALALDLIVAHGQTVYHAPPHSWQLLQPAPIVEALGVTTICDLRQADLAAGGQGAPITPLSDWILFRSPVDRAIVNLGGFCNVTFLPGGGDPTSVHGADVCACNQVLDAVARRCLGRAFDPDGGAATRGSVDPDGRDALIVLLRSQRAARRSLGTGDEAAAWVDHTAGRLPPESVAATATAAVGQVIGEALARALAPSGEVLVAGGGAHHRELVRTIAKIADRPARTLEAVGVPVGAREAIAMAVLGTLTADGLPISLERVTGRRRPRGVDGLWAFARSVR